MSDRIKNGDMPAMPTSPNDTDPAWAAARDGGLTKREVFAVAAMQGMLSNSCLSGDAESLVASSVRFADALLDELEK